MAFLSHREVRTPTFQLPQRGRRTLPHPRRLVARRPRHLLRPFDKMTKLTSAMKSARLVMKSAKRSVKTVAKSAVKDAKNAVKSAVRHVRSDARNVGKTARIAARSAVKIVKSVAKAAVGAVART